MFKTILRPVTINFTECSVDISTNGDQVHYKDQKQKVQGHDHFEIMDQPRL